MKAMEETKPDRLMWVSARDGNVRDSHERMDGRTVEFGKEFPIGVRYPLEPGGPADEVINCRCIVQPVYEDE
jgi:uncharacterized protein with gpF-like domain